MKFIKIMLLVICTLLLSNSVVSQINVLSNHNNLRRIGSNDQESVLNTQNVSPASFNKLSTKSLDDPIYAQPISSTSKVGVVYSDLVWSDEFNGSGAISSNNWFQQTQLPNGGGWYNGEMQHYTNSQTNSFQSNGSLNLVAKKETFTDQGVTKQYTSARLNSKFAFKYGRVEVRAKLPTGVGTWPAIWMLGKNIIEPGGFWSSTYGTAYWPACGEVDIMEHWGTNQNYVQSAMHTPSSYGGTFNLGGQTIATASSAYHIYTLVWTAEKMEFAVDGVIHYTYNPSVKNASTWPFDAEQYLLLNLAIQSNISSSFTEGAMEVDYVRVYQNTTVDLQAPTDLTATVGTITGSSVELLLNATDNSGNVTYNVAYGSGTSTTFGTSGVQKSLILANLSPNTNYTFTVTATDTAGNTAVNNPILVTATTTANTTTACAGTTSESSQGTFSTGYKYAFETIGTDVKFTFELLDADKVGVVAILWKQTPFGETAMTNVSGKIFTKTITGQAIGSTITYAVKFAYAGGMSVTKYFPYVVGSSCETSLTASSQTFCETATVASLVATGTALKWYDVSVGGNALSSSTALTTKTYYVSQTLAGIESERTAVSVTITPATTTGSTSVSTCGSSYTWPLNGQSYTSSGTYTYIVGCNTATLTLVLTNVTTNGSVTQSQADGSYTWPANGQTYTASTTQTVVSGCNTATLNLIISASSNDTQPTTSAPVPTKLDSDVKAIFSDTFTNISTVELFPDWQQGTKYVNYTIPASSPVNNVIKYSNLDYQGINITAAGNSPGVDFSAMTTLHIDVWTPDVDSFKLFPIDSNTDLLFKTLIPTKPGWNSYDIVLATDFPTLNKSSIRQFKFEKTAFVYKAENNTIYFDNIYFWRAPATLPTASSQTFCGTATVASLVATGTALKWYDVSVGGNALSSSTALTTKTYYVSQTLAGIESERTAVSVTITPATTTGSTSVSTCGSSYTWPLNGQSYTSSGTYTYIVGCNTATLTLVLTNVTTNGSVTQSQADGSYTWPANGQTYTASTTQTVVSGCNTATLNLIISASSNDTQPTTSAPVPTKLDSDVKAIFGDTYTNISTVELFPDWQQGTKYVNYTIPASSPVNNVIKYSNLDYQGINITAAGNSPGVDFSAMTTLHIDVWTPDVDSFKLFPIDSNTDLLFKTLTPTKPGWNSYDIVLATDFPTLNKSSIRQFKFEKTAFVYKAENNTIYFDNIYFWRAPATLPTASSQTFCETATVASLVATGTALKWYDVSVGGNALSSSIALTTKTYYVSQTLAGIESERTAVSVTITPATTTGSTSVSTCGSSYTWPLNGQSYTSSGTYTYIVGCNTATLTLILTPATNQITTVSSLNTYTWAAGNGQTYTTSGIKTGTTTNCVTELLDLTITTTSATEIPLAFPSFCKGATIATATGSTSLKFYTVATGGTALTGTTALTTRTLYLTETKNGAESTPRVAKSIVVNALPASPSTLISTQSAVICKYIGTTNPVTFTATAVGASSYNWTLPTGASILSGTGTSVVTISFENVSTAPGNIGAVIVNSVDENGCISIAKSLALTTKIPTIPTTLVLTSADTELGFNVSGVPTSLSTLVKISKVAPYIGTSKEFTLTAAVAPTADQYRWELPEGVSITSDNTTTTENGVTSKLPEITIDFADVTLGTANLVIKVYSVGGCGESTAKTLTLFRALPTKPAALVLTALAGNAIILPIGTADKITKVSPFVGKSTQLTLVATPITVQGATATSYEWEFPDGVTPHGTTSTTVNNVTTISSTSNIITVDFEGVKKAVLLLPISVYAVNGAGRSLIKTLTLTSALPKKPSSIKTPSLAVPKFNPTCANSANITVQVPFEAGCTYAWTVAGGTDRVISGNGTNSIVINVAGVTTPTLSVSVVVSNGTGSSEVLTLSISKTTTCESRIAPKAVVTDEFSIVAYPNPSLSEFTLDIQSSRRGDTGLQVYDVVGRLMENRQVKLRTIQIGANYPSGTYILKVSQGENIKTLSVIKK